MCGMRGSAGRCVSTAHIVQQVQIQSPLYLSPGNACCRMQQIDKAMICPRSRHNILRVTRIHSVARACSKRSCQPVLPPAFCFMAMQFILC